MNAFKKAQKKLQNALNKKLKAAARRAEIIALGKTVIVTEVDGVKTYSFPPAPPVPPTPPRLSWLSGKTHPQHNPQKCRSGYGPEHAEAIGEDAGRTFAKVVTDALAKEATPTIGEFADYDPAKGAAIDHSIATGEGLFTTAKPVGDPQLDHGDGL